MGVKVSGGIKNRIKSGQTRKQISRKYVAGPGPIDYSILVLTVVLLGIGLVMVYSTSFYKAQLYYKDAAYWLKKQAVFSALGLLLMTIAANFKYTTWKKKGWLIVFYVAAVGLLGLTLVLASVTYGSKRWLSLGPVSFQPSEMAKVLLILILSGLIANKLYLMKNTLTVLWVFVITLPIIGLVGVENLSTCIVMLVITMIILFVASKKVSPLLIIVGLGLAGAAVLVAIKPYRLERIKGVFDPGLQTMQGLYAIGSGGFFGKGLGQSMQKMGFVPESHNDMIFSIICEELGLFGTICILLLYAVLIWRLAVLAMNAADLYGSLIVCGVMAHIGFQTFVNVGVVTNIVPNTGVPLPFISYGGTSILFLMVEMGLVLSVSRYTKRKNQR